jgi:CRP-like cAMP-binding protein
MYLVNRGEVEILDGGGKLVSTLGAGSFFGEIALLLERPRTATVRAKGPCDTFVLEKRDFAKVLRDHPLFAERLAAIARERYDVITQATDLLGGDQAFGW